MSRILQTDFFGDNNLGLFSKACDKICVAGSGISANIIKKIRDTLGVETFQTSLANSEIVGIFCALNSNGIVLPKIATEGEVKSFKKTAGGLGMSVAVVGSRFTALGNLILCNDNGAVASRLLSSKEKRIIRDCLDVELESSAVAGLDSVGSCGIATNRGCVLHREAEEGELDRFQEILGVETDISTANFGSPYVGSCGIANSNGAVVGGSTTGPEVARIMEALGLL